MRATDKCLQVLESAQRALWAETVVPFQRAVGVTEAKVHRLVDILGVGNALLGDVANEANGHRQYPLGDGAEAVTQYCDLDAIVSW